MAALLSADGTAPVRASTPSVPTATTTSAVAVPAHAEAGRGQWLGVRFPPPRPPMTPEQTRAAADERIKAAQKATRKTKKLEDAARARSRKLQRRGLCGTGVSLGVGSNGGLCGLFNLGNTCFVSHTHAAIHLLLSLAVAHSAFISALPFNADERRAAVPVTLAASVAILPFRGVHSRDQ